MSDRAFKRVFVAGHNGMVGRAICRALDRQMPDAEPLTRTRSELDLRDREATARFLRQEKPDLVIIAAAKVGGIVANNTYPAEFIHDNLLIEANLIDGAHAADINDVLFLGSSCIYPKFAEQPMSEDALLTGVLEPTNEPYAIAKIAGIKLCESYNRQFGRDYRSAMPTNLYGLFDNFHPENSHVIPGLMRRFREAVVTGADSVTVWGSGTPRREFLFADDLAEACLHISALPKEVFSAETEPMRSHLNVGTGEDVEIAQLAHLIAATVGFEGEIDFDRSKPDGTPRKLLDVRRMERLGWRAQTKLPDGLRQTYDWVQAEGALG